MLWRINLNVIEFSCHGRNKQRSISILCGLICHMWLRRYTLCTQESLVGHHLVY